MRTTVSLDDDVLRAVRSLAKESVKNLGCVISELIREALRPSQQVTYESGIPMFQVRENAPPITPEMVGSALEDH